LALSICFFLGTADLLFVVIEIQNNIIGWLISVQFGPNQD